MPYRIKCKEGTINLGEALYLGDGRGGPNYSILVPGDNIYLKMGLKKSVGDKVEWHMSNGAKIVCETTDGGDRRYVSYGFVDSSGSQKWFDQVIWEPIPWQVKTGTSVWCPMRFKKADGSYNYTPIKFKGGWGASNRGQFTLADFTPGTDFAGGVMCSEQQLKDLCGDSYSEIPVFPGPDNEKDPPGGDGDGPEDLEDDPIEIPGDPSLSAANAGLLTLYTPTLSQIHNLGSYLWSDSFSLDTFKKLFSDPMEAIIGLSVVPVSVPTSGAQNIVIGVTDSGVSANRAASQYVTVDCGTISVKPTWNTAIDFEPYTKFSVFLPFIGTREISTDDIMGKDVNIKYLVDVFSGACTAHIKVGGSVLYQFSGSCTTPIPISALSWSNLVTSSIGLLAGGTAAAAAGGVAGGVALAAMTAGAVARSKPTIQRAGNVSGAAGLLGVRVPYLIRETPRQSLAKDYNKFVGYPSNITSKLSDLTGYTQIENVHLEGIPATGDELSEIESLLKEGVIL